ncbi:transposase [Nocardia vinacea]|uniref:transposase n=1 Tax=Nocardia vinacea TaxID=96468 RepID=UPI0033F5146E
MVTSITGLSAVGAAAILAQTGDPTRFTTARALVEHAGLAPREKLSGTFTGRTKLTGQGPAQPAPSRLAGGLGRPTRQPCLCRPLPAPDQPRRQQTQPHPSPNRHRRSHPATPACRHHHRPTPGSTHRHPRHTTNRHPNPGGRLPIRAATERSVGASPTRHRDTHHDLAGNHRQPRPSSPRPDYTLLGSTPSPLCRDHDR